MADRDTIPHRLLRQAASNPSTIAYQAKLDGRWQPTTWQTFASQVRTAARALIALGFPRGGKVAILGFNRPEWVILDHAAMMAGGAAAGIYTTCSPDEVQYILHHSEAHVVLVEDAGQLEKVTSRRDQLPLLRWIVLMRGAQLPATGGDGILSWEDLHRKGEAPDPHDAEIDARLAALQPADLATLIYTSGTTGPPKGVMLSHANLAWTSQTLIDVGGGKIDGDCSLSYLPLSHIAEQMGTIHMPATAGSTVYFAESIDKLADNIKECRPTVFFGVPRVWEKFHAVLAARLGEVTGGKRRILDWARRVCTEVNARRDRGDPMPWLLRTQYALADRLVIGKLKAALGFDRARVLSSGAAPIAPDVLAFFASIDLPIREVYGQSEDTGPTSYNMPGRTRIGSVGPPIPGLEVKIAEDGEILVRGPNVFLGYYKEPQATAETLKDGWLCSGDLGVIDKDGFITITGRKKEIIITAGGKNVAPKNIEAALKESLLISEAMVIGDRRKFLTALVTLDEAVAQKLAPDVAAGQLAAAPAIQTAVQSQVDAVNQTLARVEQIKKFTILPQPFSIAGGELTPTMKLKRKVIAQRYEAQIDAMYADGD
ncbi:MAG TPA: long-chain fatty acid--CoA ligase [Kofleriaceae bacterium]|jgi:long-chain acyl-CoA synthetase|nr:long-chain fatty acid--CoA ligase [Kofleriaceae bacterium]